MQTDSQCNYSFPMPSQVLRHGENLVCVIMYQLFDVLWQITFSFGLYFVNYVGKQTQVNLKSAPSLVFFVYSIVQLASYPILFIRYKRRFQTCNWIIALQTSEQRLSTVNVYIPLCLRVFHTQLPSS